MHCATPYQCVKGTSLPTNNLEKSAHMTFYVAVSDNSVKLFFGQASQNHRNLQSNNLGLSQKKIYFTPPWVLGKSRDGRREWDLYIFAIYEYYETDIFVQLSTNSKNKH